MVYVSMINVSYVMKVLWKMCISCCTVESLEKDYWV